MSNHEHAQMMLVMAEKDFDAIQLMLGNPRFSEEVFGFHAQQAVEKALKTWLTLQDCEYPKTHDLRSLVALFQNAADLPMRFRSLLNLSAFGVEFRYHPYEASDSPLNRPELARLIEDLISHVKGLFR